MKKLSLFLLAPALVLGLEACPMETISSVAAQSVGLPPSPQAVANRTQLDETLLTSVELAYKAARIAVEIYVDSGHCTGVCATRFRTLNRQAYAAVQTAERAYRVGNSAGYMAALAEARGFSNDLLNLTGRNN